MNRNADELRIALAAITALTIGSFVLAQTPALTAPNNSAGTPNEPPEGKKPDVARPAPGTIIPKAALPTRAETSRTAFQKLDPEKRGYLTLSDILQLPGSTNFDEADRNKDGKLSFEEFEPLWSKYRTSQ